MGISNVAVKTFDSTGAQSLCRTNDYKGDEEIKSSFISKCQKMYISGSGETVIAGSLRTFPTTTKATDTFYINSDTDAISDITLNIEFKLRAIDVTFAGTWMAHVAKDIILSLIDKVEIKSIKLMFLLFNEYVESSGSTCKNTPTYFVLKLTFSSIKFIKKYFLNFVYE